MVGRLVALSWNLLEGYTGHVQLHMVRYSSTAHHDDDGGAQRSGRCRIAKASVDGEADEEVPLLAFSWQRLIPRLLLMD